MPYKLKILNKDGSQEEVIGETVASFTPLLEARPKGSMEKIVYSKVDSTDSSK